MCKYEGKLEASLSEPYLYGDIYANPTNIIRTDQVWRVKIYWDLEGSLAEYICGEWHIRLCLKSIGKGPERNWKAPKIRWEP